MILESATDNKNVICVKFFVFSLLFSLKKGLLSERGKKRSQKTTALLADFLMIYRHNNVSFHDGE